MFKPKDLVGGVEEDLLDGFGVIANVYVGLLCLEEDFLS